MRLNETLHQALEWWREKTAPFRTKYQAVATPIREAWHRLIAPVRVPWRKLTAPLRERWAAFAAQHPKSAFTIDWFWFFTKIGMLVVGLLVFGVWRGWFGALPTAEELVDIETANASYVYSSDDVLLGKYYLENRNVIDVNDVSPFVIKALIATEDKRFLEHKGIDLRSWGRVGFGMLTGKNKGGGSTLSQQLAKNLYPRKRYPGGKIPSLVINKLRENFTSVKLEKVYSKEQILGLYLNTVPFGNDIFGISVAAKRYFNKTAKDLSSDEAAILIGMLKATTYYNPVRNPKNSERRRNEVLRQMVKNNDLSEAEYEELSKKPVSTTKYYRETTNDGKATYFREHLRLELRKKLKQYKREDGQAYNLYTDGLRIYTTINTTMQDFADEAVRKYMKINQENFDKDWARFKKEKPWGDDKYITDALKNSPRYQRMKEKGAADSTIIKAFETPVDMRVFSWKNNEQEVDTTLSPIDSIRYYFTLLNCGFMAMDHRNGYVRAWVGGVNFKHFKYDHVRSTRQVGSTFKPIVYAAALKDGADPCSYWQNELYAIGDWEPKNSNDEYGGYYSMAGALQNSVNTVTAQMIDYAGVKPTMDLAKSMGVTNRLPREAGIALGSGEVSLFDMVTVYGTFANKGRKIDPVYLLRVETKEGEVLYDYKEEMEKKEKKRKDEEPPLSEDEALIMTEMMKNVVNEGTGRRMRYRFHIEGELAGKTGTTQNQSDGWFMCYNPVLVTGAWVGAEVPVVHFKSMRYGQGASTALPIVGGFWQQIAKHKKYRKFLYTTFRGSVSDTLPMWDCETFLDYHPDSVYIDTLALFGLDSTQMPTFERLKEGLGNLFGKSSNGEGKQPASEGTSKRTRQPQREQSKKEKRKEKRKQFFDDLFNKDGG